MNSNKAVELIFKTAHEAKENNEEGILLVVGTSMGTNFANVLVYLAQKQGMKVVYINNDADKEIEEFFSN